MRCLCAQFPSLGGVPKGRGGNPFHEYLRNLKKMDPRMCYAALTSHGDDSAG